MTLRRSPFKSKAPPPRPVKQWDGEVKPRSPALRIADTRARLVVPIEKTPDRKSEAIRDSARGEECTVRIVGACSFDPAMTIWSHAPLEAAGKGRSLKALDLCGAYACTACDAVVDGQRRLPPGASRTSVLLDWHNGHMRSLVRLRQKGLA